MKKIVLIACAATAAITLHAQSAIDAYNLSQSSLRGTARFMSMGGAFTALGGDLSALNQNPAGIGVYRGSEVGLTLDVNMTSGQTSDIDVTAKQSKTYFNCNNVGYVGTINFGPNETLQTISWGISYNRAASFDRNYSGGFNSLQSSMSNYVASYTTQNQVNPDNLLLDSSYNPYQDSSNDWLSILSYNSLMINPVMQYDSTTHQTTATSNYTGLFQYGNYGSPATTGYADFGAHEKGYVDEFSVVFGGNVADVVMWGASLGITDINFTQEMYWDENLTNALVCNATYDGTEIGDAATRLYNYKHITGAGVNVKLGVIAKPIPELRLGFAFHTPTFYNLTTEYNADVYARYSSINDQIYQYTDMAHFDWKMTSPWKMMFGVAGVIGGRGILSLDYERTDYGSMRVSDSGGNEYNDITAQVKAAYKVSNTIRLGAEYRVTPQLSLRAGYSYTSSSAKKEAVNQDVQVVSYDTNPAYTLTGSTNTVSVGLGYRYQGFYADFAYLYRTRKADYYAYTPYADANDGNYWTEAPHAKLTDNSNQLVFTFGYKF